MVEIYRLPSSFVKLTWCSADCLYIDMIFRSGALHVSVDVNIGFVLACSTHALEFKEEVDA